MSFGAGVGVKSQYSYFKSKIPRNFCYAFPSYSDPLTRPLFPIPNLALGADATHNDLQGKTSL